MKKFLAPLFLVWIMCLSCVRTNFVLNEDGYVPLIDAVVAIKLPLGLCSGFFIEQNRILTSAHCMVNAGPSLRLYEVVTYRQYLQNADLENSSLYMLMYVDHFRDLAVLDRIYSNSELEVRIPEIYNGTYPAIGTPTICIGHPARQLFTVTTGVISRIGMFDADTGVSYVFSSTPVWFGNSGGPLFDNQGRILGLTRGIIQDQSYLGRFVSWQEIRQFLGEIHEQEEQENSQNSR